MKKDWIRFFKLVGNPFATIPLQTREHFDHLFVKTDDVTKQIDPMIEYFEQSPPFLRVISAPRGSGKSTILHYMAFALRSKTAHPIVSFISHQPAVLKGERDPAYGIGNDTVSKIVMDLAERLLDFEEGKNKSVLRELLSDIGMTTPKGTLDSRSVTTFSYTTNRNRLEKLLQYMKDRRIRAFLAIDNYDKLDEDRAIGFLKSGHAQPLFEDLQSAGVSIVIAASLAWAENIGEGDLSYLGRPIVLNPLNPIEAGSMVRKRIASRSSTENIEIFEDAAISRITIREEGIARNILETCRLCMTKAAERERLLISEEFIKEVLRSQERTGAKYYKIIKKEPNARIGLTILSGIAKEVDPDTFRLMLQGLADIMEERSPSSDVIERLRQHRIFYLGERTVEAKKLRHYVASEIQVLLRTVAKKYPLNVFMDWLAAGEPAFWFIPTTEERRADSTIEEQFHLLLPAFTGDVKLLLRNAYTSYRAWASQIEQGDFNVPQILSDMWMSIWGLAVCAYHSTQIVREGVFEPPKPSYEKIENFLLTQDEVVKKLPDFATLHQYYVYAEKGVPIEPSLLESLYSRIQNLVASLLDLSMVVLPYLRKLGIPLPKFKVRHPEELDQRLAPYLKADNRYFYQFLGNVPPSEFLMLHWMFRNYVYSIFVGKKGFVSDYGFDLYEVKTSLPYYVPDFIDAQLSLLGLPQGILLRYYNSLEFCSFIFRTAKKHETFLKMFSKKSTADLAFTAEDGSVLVSVDFSEGRYGSKIDLSAIPSALSHIRTLARPPKLFISHSGKDKNFVERLAQDLKRKGVKVWVDFWEIKVGDSIVAKIEEAIQRNDYLAVVLTPSSVKSNWVQKELAAGLVTELEEKSVVVLPLLAKKCKIPSLLKDKKYADFVTNYHKGLQELLDRLNE